MFFFYIDESGTSLGNKDRPFFVLAAVAVDAAAWPGFDKFIHGLKYQVVPWAKPEDWELKGRTLRQGGRDTVFSSLNLEARSVLITRVAEAIYQFDLHFFAVRVFKPSLPTGVLTDPDLYRVATWALLTQTNDFLHRSNATGILFFDSRSTLSSAKQDRRVIDAYREWTARPFNVEIRFAELPWFGESSFYSGLQIADFVAYLVDFASEADYKNRYDNDDRATRNAFSLLRRHLIVSDVP